MVLATNGINIDKLDFTPKKIVVKSLKEYKEDTKNIIDRIREDAKKGIATFRDNTEVAYTKPSLKMDF